MRVRLTVPEVMPVRFRSDVELPSDLAEKMIPDEEYADTIPLTDNDAVSAACAEIASRWEEEIIPLMN